MIIKIISRKNHSFRQLLQYMVYGDERVPESRIILHNLNGNTIYDWIKEFEENESYRNHRRKNSVILTHEILSWHPEDTPYLTLDAIENMTREYIEQRNPNGLYVGAIHLLKNHYHVHLCVSGVEYKSGNVMRISKGRLSEIKRSIQAYEKEHYPELIHSQVLHGKSRNPQLTDREYWYKRNHQKEPLREKLSQRISHCLQNARSQDEFTNGLKHEGLEPYYRKGKLKGIWYNNRKYRLQKLGVLEKDLAKLQEKTKELSLSRG